MKIFHLQLKNVPDEVAHHYYKTLTALCLQMSGAIGVSRSSLEKYDFQQPYENDTCIIRKGAALNKADILGKTA